jgi:hypothetical protein
MKRKMGQRASSANVEPGILRCDAKVKLLDDYVNATEAYLDLLTVLSARIRKVDKAEYWRLHAIADNCRTKSENASGP